MGVGPSDIACRAGFAFSKPAERLTSLVELTTDDLDLLADMPSSIAHFGAHRTILRHGDKATQCCLLLDGYLSWQNHESAHGQITAICVPGDIANLHNPYRPRIDGDPIAPLPTPARTRPALPPSAGRPGRETGCDTSS